MKHASIIALLLAALFPQVAAGGDFDDFCETFSAAWVRADPQLATTLQYFNGAEQDALDRRLTPITREARTARIAAARRGLAELKRFDTAGLDASQRISAAVLQWHLDDITRGEPFADYAYVFQQYNGLQVQLVNFLTQTHPIRNRRDIENYLARLELVASQIDEGIEQAKDRAARGILPPRFILVATIEQFSRFLAGPSQENVLVASLAERAARVKELSSADRTTFLAAAEKSVSASIIPAFRRAREMLESQLNKAVEDAGLGRFPDGDRAYAQALRRYTTTDYSAAQIHALGLKEVARIEKQMDELLRECGYDKGSVEDRMKRLDADSQPPDVPDPRAVILAKYEEILRDAQMRSNTVFDLRPKAAVVVKREPEFTEKNASAHYAAPAADGSRPGVFWVPLPGPPYRICEMRTLLYHEAIPGHHFQIALQNEMSGLPRFRRERVFGSISAFSEGWALYAERLAAELGWYDSDPKGQLGQLNAELFRARRLVVDTGLHALRWTRQQAIDYGVSATEVDRYVVTPGQACSYKIGQLRILELRDNARSVLAEKFSLQGFHNVVLRAGTVPLDVLQQVLDNYVKTSDSH
ncbi:MAG: DUF885 domain-containing protein [Verrucomicrobia bacterium]|nr:MAG: DUF885 domain-containing protein [Verrucomicrobiota bacterium]